MPSTGGYQRVPESLLFILGSHHYDYDVLQQGLVRKFKTVASYLDDELLRNDLNDVFVPVANVQEKTIIFQEEKTIIFISHIT